MVATEVDIDEDNFKSSHGNMLSKEQETVDLEGFELIGSTGSEIRLNFSIG